VDSDRAPVGPFVDGLGISFDVLWDEGSKVGRQYRASSIPLSYLIDPAGRIVGVAQGARDWSQMDDLLEALVAQTPPDPATPRAYASAGPVELESVTEPPTAEVSLSTPSPVAGESFVLDVRLLWAGDFAEYVPMPPQVQLPEGVERLGVEASTSSVDGRSVVSYRITLRASEPGSYALDPIELRYTPRTDPAPLTTRLLGPTVTVVEAPVLGPGGFTLALAGAVLLLIAGAAALIVRRRRRPATASDDSAPLYDRLRSRFDGARAKRVQGDAAGFIADVTAILAELDSDDRSAELDELIERVRYGGQTPPAEELDRLQRHVKRRLDSLRPDPEENEREAVRLAEEGE
jgi:hypothetical protein